MLKNPMETRRWQIANVYVEGWAEWFVGVEAKVEAAADVVGDAEFGADRTR